MATALPGVGPAFGSMTVSKQEDNWALSGELQTVDGQTLPLKGSVNIYTGYEWRASVSVGDDKYRQVLALSADGNTLKGRQFAKSDNNLGGDFQAVKQGGTAQILAVYPESLKPVTARTCM
ncbi:MAG: hypothetical protein R3E95_12010 [Thiolinea sp.]